MAESTKNRVQALALAAWPLHGANLKQPYFKLTANLKAMRFRAFFYWYSAVAVLALPATILVFSYLIPASDVAADAYALVLVGVELLWLIAGVICLAIPFKASFTTSINLYFGGEPQ